MSIIFLMESKESLHAGFAASYFGAARLPETHWVPLLPASAYSSRSSGAQSAVLDIPKCCAKVFNFIGELSDEAAITLGQNHVARVFVQVIWFDDLGSVLQSASVLIGSQVAQDYIRGMVHISQIPSWT